MNGPLTDGYPSQLEEPTNVIHHRNSQKSANRYDLFARKRFLRAYWSSEYRSGKSLLNGVPVTHQRWRASSDMQARWNTELSLGLVEKDPLPGYSRKVSRVPYLNLCSLKRCRVKPTKMSSLLEAV